MLEEDSHRGLGVATSESGQRRPPRSSGGWGKESLRVVGERAPSDV